MKRQLIATVMGQKRKPGLLLSVASAILLVVASILVVEGDARYAMPVREQEYKSDTTSSDLDDPPVINKTQPSRRFVRQSATNSDLRHWWEGDSSYDDTTVLPCDNNGISCRYIETCGRAPLNPITKGQERIINGQNQTHGEWPSYVYLQLMVGPKRGASCGGTLVSNKHVLTAAHCVWQYDGVKETMSLVRPEGATAFFGVHHSVYGQSVQRIKVERICFADDYFLFPIARPTLFSDWALLELAEPVKLNDHVQPACLPFKPIKKEGKDSKCYAVGRGNTREYENNSNVPDKPWITQKLSFERVKCEMQEIQLPGIGNFIDCYANLNKPPGGVCHGDSGGPVLCLDDEQRWTLAGIASQATACFEKPKLPRMNMYTPVRKFLNHIKSQCSL